MNIPEISILTIEQKLQLLNGKDFISTKSLDGLLPEVFMIDGPCGINRPMQNDKGEWYYVPSTLYPAPVVIANTWDRNMARLMGECLGDDAIDLSVDVVLAPGINIKRLSTCGRNFEYFSEDPFLAGNMAKEYVNGVQSRNVGGCLKHYLANNAEYDRMYQSSEIDERTLREIYLPAFEIACQSNPYLVMCSYNNLNGVKVAENKKAFDILRKDLGFKGLVVSDWCAVYDSVKSIKAGLNLEMPYNANSYESLKAAYDNGVLTENEIDFAVGKILELVRKTVKNRKIRKAQFTPNERKANCQKIAENGIVLLKNEKNILPLKKDCKISLSGYCVEKLMAGGGSALMFERAPSRPLNECIKEAMPNARILFESATKSNDQIINMAKAIENAKLSDVALVAVGTGKDVESEGFDRTDIKLSRVQEDLIVQTASANPNTIVILYAGSAIDVSNWIDKVKGVIFVGFGGTCAHEAVSNVICGKVNPSGKLSQTFPIKLSDELSSRSFMDFNKAVYEEGLDVGYRYFASKNVPTRFPFGYGLSYSKFEYSNLKTEKVEEFNVTVSVDVKNVSKVDGAEVVQLYVGDVVSSVYRPIYELKGFDKKFIKAGETERFTFELDKRAFAFYSAEKKKWLVEPGDFEIRIGASVEDARLVSTVSI